MQTAADEAPQGGELEFFGVRIKVSNPRLAELLNSGVTEDVQVVGKRARALTGPEAAGAEDAAAEQALVQRVLQADDVVSIRKDEVQDL